MIVSTRVSVQVADRRQRVMRQYLNGKYQTEIAEMEGVDQSTISRDIAAIHDMWRASAIRDFDLLKQKELNRIDALERTYWEAWEESKKERNIKSQRKMTGAQDSIEVKLTTEERLADPRYLQGIQWCISERCKILGLHDNTQRVQLETWEDRLIGLIKNGKVSYNALVEELKDEDIAKDFFKKAGVEIE